MLYMCNFRVSLDGGEPVPCDMPVTWKKDYLGFMGADTLTEPVYFCQRHKDILDNMQGTEILPNYRWSPFRISVGVL